MAAFRDTDVEDAITLSVNSYFSTKYGPFNTKEEFVAAKNKFIAAKTIFNEDVKLHVIMTSADGTRSNTDTRNVVTDDILEGVASLAAEAKKTPATQLKTVGIVSSTGSIMIPDQDMALNPREFVVFRMCRSCGVIVDPEFQANQLLMSEFSPEKFAKLKESNALPIVCEVCAKNFRNGKGTKKGSPKFQFALIEIQVCKFIWKLEYVSKEVLAPIALVEGSASINPNRISKSVDVLLEYRNKMMEPTSKVDARKRINDNLEELRAKLEETRVACCKLIEKTTELIPEAIGSPQDEILPIKDMIRLDLESINRQAQRLNLTLVYRESEDPKDEFWEIERFSSDTLLVRALNSCILAFNLKVRIINDERKKVNPKLTGLETLLSDQMSKLHMMLSVKQPEAFDNFASKLKEIIGKD